MKIRSILSMACALAGALHIPASADPMPLFHIYSDADRQRPRDNEPYFIFLDGSPADRGVTDASGAIVTQHRRPRTRQEFVARIFGFGTYSFVVDEKDKVSIEVIAPWSFGENWQQRCDPEQGDCKGKGFYWLQLMGIGSTFAGEPYTLSIGDRRISGQVSKDGHVFAPFDNPPDLQSLTLQLCSGPALQVRIGLGFNKLNVTPKAAVAGLTDGCNASRLRGYQASHRDRNRGMPYVFGEWSKGMTPDETAQQAARAEEARKGDYTSRASRNDDLLSWLGPLPAVWSDEDYERKLSAVSTKIQGDLADASGYDVRTFKCRSPKDVGPVPQLDAVDRYLRGFPGSMGDTQQVAALHAAARSGNWLAVAQVYALLAQSRLGDDAEGDIGRYRIVQLMEWMQARKIGPLYREFGYALAASGYPGRGDPIQVYAALHDSYPAQFEVGEKLQRNGDRTLAQIGRQMMACARNALPGYAAAFGR